MSKDNLAISNKSVKKVVVEECSQAYFNQELTDCHQGENLKPESKFAAEKLQELTSNDMTKSFEEQQERFKQYESKFKQETQNRKLAFEANLIALKNELKSITKDSIISEKFDRNVDQTVTPESPSIEVASNFVTLSHQPVYQSEHDILMEALKLKIKDEIKKNKKQEELKTRQYKIEIAEIISLNAREKAENERKFRELEDKMRQNEANVSNDSVTQRKKLKMADNLKKMKAERVKNLKKEESERIKLSRVIRNWFNTMSPVSTYSNPTQDVQAAKSRQNPPIFDYDGHQHDIFWN